MPVTVVPPFPLRSQGKTQAQYSTEFEASMTALPLMITDLNAVGSAYALATNATSNTSNAIGTGSKSFTTQTNLGYQIGQTIRIAANSTNFMTGEVTSYNIGTGALVVSVTAIIGTGTFASWFISQAAVGASTAATISNIPTGNISATTVQAAINELDTEKLSSAAGAVTGTQLENIITASTVGSPNAIPVITFDQKGRITATTSAFVTSGFSNMRVITATETWTVPSGITKVKATVVGGGGTAANTTGAFIGNGTAGGGGGCAIGIYTVTPLANIDVTVGGANTASSFGAFASASAGSTTSGGIGTGGQINIVGQNGYAGAGGDSFLGYGGQVSGVANANGSSGTGYGAGGSGGNDTSNVNSTTGGAGTAGVVILEW